MECPPVQGQGAANVDISGSWYRAGTKLSNSLCLGRIGDLYIIYIIQHLLFMPVNKHRCGLGLQTFQTSQDLITTRVM